MQNLGNINKARVRRPYWLLLALVLFFAGQVATAAHWHNDLDKLDADCALCVLSSAASAAIVTAALTFASVALSAFVLVEIIQTIAHRCVRSYDSRAPPLHS